MRKEVNVAKQRAKDINIEQELEQEPIQEETCKCNSQCNCGDECKCDEGNKCSENCTCVENKDYLR